MDHLKFYLSNNIDGIWLFKISLCMEVFSPKDAVLTGYHLFF